MGILFDNPPQEEKESNGFHLTLEKYKNVVFVKSIKVSEDDDCVLTVEFDHSIDAPEGEVADEVGRLILEKLEQGLGMMDTDNITVEKE